MGRSSICVLLLRFDYFFPLYSIFDDTHGYFPYMGQVAAWHLLDIVSIHGLRSILHLGKDDSAVAPTVPLIHPLPFSFGVQCCLLADTRCARLPLLRICDRRLLMQGHTRPPVCFFPLAFTADGPETRTMGDEFHTRIARNKRNQGYIHMRLHIDRFKGLKAWIHPQSCPHLAGIKAILG